MIWIGFGFLTLLVLLGALRWAAFARVGQIKALIGGLIAVALVLVAAVFLATGRIGISWPFLLGAWFASQRVRQGIGLVRFLRQLFGDREPGSGSRAASPPPPNGNMDVREACAILGIDADADPDAIRAAHRRLIQQLHPDRGGSGYLAAKINQAKDVLLKRR